MKSIPKENILILTGFSTFNVLVMCLHFLFHPVRIFGMDKSLFYLDEQVTLAVFSTVVTSFLTGFFALSILAKIKDKLLRKLYFGLGSFFILLSFDEYLEIHEYANTLVKTASVEGSLLNRVSNTSWIFPLLIIVILVIAMFIFLIIKEKNRWVRYPVVLGLFSFVIVLFLEIAGSYTFGKDIYVVFVGFEEGLEMIGCTLFLFAILNKKSELEHKA